MNDLSLFLEFIFWVVLRSGLIIVGAWLLIDIYDIIDELEEEFIKICGASTCHAIKTENGTPCQVCVDTADKLVEKYTKK